MIIKDISLHASQYQMINNLEATNFTHNIRDSWILKITDNEGFVGYGEASPLFPFNNESFEESGYCIEGFKLALSNINDDISLDELIILSDVHSLNAPSANFAIQTAIYDLFSKNNNKSFSIFINKKSLTEVKSNGIYGLTSINN